MIFAFSQKKKKKIRVEFKTFILGILLKQEQNYFWLEIPKYYGKFSLLKHKLM